MADQQGCSGASGGGHGDDTGLLGFIQLLAVHRVRADPAQLLHERGAGDRPFEAADMLRAAKRFRVRARIVRRPASALGSMPLPTLARARDGSWFLLARAAVEAGRLNTLSKPTIGASRRSGARRS